MTEPLAINGVTIPQQPPGRGIVRKGVDQLLGGPSSRGMLRDIDVHNSSARLREQDEHEQHPAGECGDREEVDGDH
jgi:hypothetical protein